MSMMSATMSGTREMIVTVLYRRVSNNYGVVTLRGEHTPTTVLAAV